MPSAMRAPERERRDIMVAMERLSLTRALPLVCAVLLAPLPAAGDHELHAPASEFSLEIGPEDPPVQLRIYWSCYERDLADAARSVVASHARGVDCDLIHGHYVVLYGSWLGEAESSAGKLPIGDAHTGAVQVFDPPPGETLGLDAEHCYSAESLDRIADWIRSELGALCPIAAPSAGTGVRPVGSEGSPRDGPPAPSGEDAGASRAAPEPGP